MPISIDSMMMREMMMDHYDNPRNKEEVKDPRYKSIRMNSSSCIDDITVQVLLDKDVIEDVKWFGTACVISTAATSVMSELVKGKTLKEAADLMDNYMKMLKSQPYDQDKLQEAIIFQNVGRQASRIGCATIGWRGLFQAMVKEDGKEGDK